MHVILVTGSDTGIGKTHVTAAIARLAAKAGKSVRIVKAVETGRGADEPGDAERARTLAEAEGITTTTLRLFTRPLAPLAAARLDGKVLRLPDVVAALEELPPADVRIIEGAGGIAVPVDLDGSDWATFARKIAADRVVLVVPDRLGAINQARLLWSYAEGHSLPAGLWFNEHERQDEEIRQSNQDGVAAFALPVWGRQRSGTVEPEDPEQALRYLLD